MIPPSPPYPPQRSSQESLAKPVKSFEEKWRNMWEWIDLGAKLVMTTWVISGAILRVLRYALIAAPGIIRVTYGELCPFYLPAVFFHYAFDAIAGGPSHLTWIGVGVYLFNWVVLKGQDDDEDRWKRRRKKAAEKIAAVAGRLTVQPAGA